MTARRHLIFAFEIIILSALILTTRCANYRDVFIGGNIYFVDADCYARMTRVRLCTQHPGLILRHHAFENYPDGTTPHTTAPLDYLILFVSVLLRPFTSRSIDLAGALVSPFLAILTGIFLCLWARLIRLPYRWTMLALFAISPILVHGTSLGRPDHQSVLITLVIVAVCADWIVLYRSESIRWSVVSGLAWGFAIWVSAYEPLILLLVRIVAGASAKYISRKWNSRSPNVFGDGRTTKGSGSDVNKNRQLPVRLIVCGCVLLAALLIERRLPAITEVVRDPIFRNWTRTIGELVPVPLFSGVWFSWLGWLVVIVPVLPLLGRKTQSPNRRVPVTVVVLFVITLCLTSAQARWGYFLAAFFVLILPTMLGFLRLRLVGWLLFVCSLWPVLADWDKQLWPDDAVAARQLDQRREAIELRELSVHLMSADLRPVLAPWWLSPAIVYWSGQPAVAGSSHESLPGIVDSARFFLAEDPNGGWDILQKRKVGWVISYDAERVEKNSSVILGQAASDRCLARVLDRRPSGAPAFLTLSVQNGTAKIYKVINKW